MNIIHGIDYNDYGYSDATFGILIYKDLFIRVGLFFISFEIGYDRSQKYFLATLRAGLPSRKVYVIQIQKQ